MATRNRRKLFFSNRMHRDIFLLVALASLIPASIVGICLYYLMFSAIAQQIGISEAIALNVLPGAIKVISVLMLAAPVSVVIILFLAAKITRNIVGPFDRLVREVEECVRGDRKGPLVVRKFDKFRPLVDQVNKLLDKLR